MPEFQLSHYPQVGIILQLARFTAENYRAGVSDAALTLEMSTKFCGSFHNVWKMPTSTFFLRKAPHLVVGSTFSINNKESRHADSKDPMINFAYKLVSNLSKYCEIS